MTENEIIREIKRISSDNSHRFSFIAKYIVDNFRTVPYMTIKEMADNTYTSIATINRFVKFLNLDGYKELVHIVKFFNNNFIDNNEIFKTDSQANLFSKTYQNVVKSLDETYRLTLSQGDDVKAVANLISQARRINIFAVGGTYNIAKDFGEKLLRIGFNVLITNDLHVGYYLVQQTTAEDLTIIISYSGETLDLIKLAKISQEKDTPVVAFCRKANNTLQQNADYAITIISEESIERLVSTTSRFALLFALDIVYLSLISENLEYYKDLLNRTILPKF